MKIHRTYTAKEYSNMRFVMIMVTLMLGGLVVIALILTSHYDREREQLELSSQLETASMQIERVRSVYATMNKRLASKDLEIERLEQQIAYMRSHAIMWDPESDFTPDSRIITK